MTDPAPATDAVRISRVPVRLFLESQDHQHDLVRELQLIHIGDRREASGQTPRRISDLIADILSRYEAVRTATRRQVVAALERGEDYVDLDVPVYPGMASALREWLTLLEEADRVCAEGRLLLLASRPEIRELRRWYVDEIASRLEAETPRVHVEQLDHIAIAVADLERSREWYERVLGLKRRYEEAWTDFPIVLCAGEACIALFPRSPGAATGGGLRHIAFRTSAQRFREAKEGLEREGLQPEFQDHGISHSLYVSDPDGYQIEITTYELVSGGD